MNIDRQRHRLLSIVSERLVELEVNRNSDVKIGICFDELKTKLKCSDSELRKVVSKLFEEEEVDLYNVSFKGLYCKEKGLSSFQDKKYIRELEKRFFEKAKNWVQVLIPVLSLVFSIIIFIYAESRLKQDQKEIDKLKKEVELFKKSNGKQIMDYVNR